jgi:EAL domain-containing protein (putative c-di-GMP-specific phosphodiesterase class I)
VRFFDDALAQDAHERHHVEIDLRDAREHDWFRLHYQPVIDLDSGAVAGVEALLRLDHPQRGLVEAGRFLPVAEDTGLIVPIGAWAVHEACRRLAAWQRLHLPREPVMAVNLSGRQVLRGDMEDLVEGALDRTGAHPRQLCIELTESVLMGASNSVINALKRLRARGVRLALDDFGTGFSSLTYLRQYPVDVIKLDRSFTSFHSVRDAAIVAAVISLGEDLGLDVIAEGVEDPSQLERLRDLGCHLAQGHLFAPALDAATATDLLSRHTPVSPLPAQAQRYGRTTTQ